MSVHYKFKSALEYDTVAFDGLHISVKDLKNAIIQQKRIGKSTDFDLQVTNAQTKEVYEDENTLIAKNTSLLIARVPIIAQKQKQWEGYGGDNTPPAKLDEGGPIAKATDLSSLDAPEDDKIKAMMSQSTQDYDPSNYQKIRGANQMGAVPPNYRCYKCHQGGHWIKDCTFSLGTDPIEIKKSTGIPKSFMVPVEGPQVPGAMMTPNGQYAVPILDHQAYNQKAHPAPTMEPKPEIPEDLICSICSDLLTDAVMIPCCGNSFCDECVRSVLLESEDHECPDCHEKDISPDTLIPNRFIRTSVGKFKNTTGYVKRSVYRQPKIVEPPISIKRTSPMPEPESSDRLVDQKTVISEADSTEHSRQDENSGIDKNDLKLGSESIPEGPPGVSPRSSPRERIRMLTPNRERDRDRSSKHKFRERDDSPRRSSRRHRSPTHKDSRSAERSATPTVDEPNSAAPMNYGNHNFNAVPGSMPPSMGIAPPMQVPPQPIPTTYPQNMALGNQPPPMGAFPNQTGAPQGPPPNFRLPPPGTQPPPPYMPPGPYPMQSRPMFDAGRPPIGGIVPSYNSAYTSQTRRDYGGRRIRDRTPPGVIDDPLAAFNRMLREKDEQKRRQMRRTQRQQRSFSRSRSRSRSDSRSPPPLDRRRRRMASRSPPPIGGRRLRISKSRSKSRSRSRSRSFSLSRSRSRSYSGSPLPPPRRSSRRSPPPGGPRRAGSRYKSPPPHHQGVGRSRSPVPPQTGRSRFSGRDRSYDSDRDYGGPRRVAPPRDRRSRDRDVRDRDRYYDGRSGAPSSQQWGGQQRPQDYYGGPPPPAAVPTGPPGGYQPNRYNQGPPPSRDYGPPAGYGNVSYPQTIHAVPTQQRQYQDIRPPGVDDELAPPGVDDPPPKSASPRRDDRERDRDRDRTSVDKKEADRDGDKRRKHEKRSRTPDKPRNATSKRRSKSRDKDRHTPEKKKKRRDSSEDRRSDDEKKKSKEKKKHHKDKKETEKKKKRDKKEKHKKDSKEKKSKEDLKPAASKDPDTVVEETAEEKTKEKRRKEVEEDKRLEERASQSTKRQKTSETAKERSPKEKSQKEEPKPSRGDSVVREEQSVKSPQLEKRDLYDDVTDQIDTKLVETYGKVEDMSFEERVESETMGMEEPIEEGEIKETEEEKDVLELHTTDVDLKTELDKNDILAPVPEKSKWEVDDEILSSPKDSIKSDTKSEKSGKVTTEVLKRAENAIFAKAINAIRPIEIKKISTDRAKLYSGETDKQEVVLIPSTPEIKKEPPARLPVKERLGIKVDDPDKIINLTGRNRSRTISPFSRRGESCRNYGMGERRIDHEDFRRGSRRSRSRGRRNDSRERYRQLDVRHHEGKSDGKKIDKRKERKDEKRHDDKKRRKRSRSHSEGEEKKHRKKDKKAKKEKPKKNKEEEKEDDAKPAATSKRKPTIDESNFEPDYDLESNSDDDNNTSSSDSDSDSSSEEEKKKRKHKKKRKKKKRESSSSSSSESESDSSDSDRGKKRKKHKKNKKKKKKSKHK